MENRVEVLSVGGELKGVKRIEGNPFHRILNSLKKGNRIVLVGFGRDEGFWPNLLSRLKAEGAEWPRVRYVDERDSKISGCELEELVRAWDSYLSSAGPMSPIPRVNGEGCSRLNYCDLCLGSCPYDAMKGKPPSFDPDRCMECGLCVNYCPSGLISDSSSYQSFKAYLPEIGCADGLIVLCPKGREMLYSDVRELGLVPFEVPCLPSFSIRHILLSDRMGYAVSLYCPNSLRSECPNGPAVDVYEGMLGELGVVLNLGYKISSVPGREERPRAVFKDEDLWVRLRYLPFFRPVVGEGCTLCGVCEVACPTKALKLEKGDMYRLLLDHSKCVGCKACEEACPEGAVRVERGVNPSLLEGRVVEVASSEAEKCIKCSKIIGPKAMISKLERVMREKGMPDSVIESLRICDECKKKMELGLL